MTTRRVRFCEQKWVHSRERQGLRRKYAPLSSALRVSRPGTGAIPRTPCGGPVIRPIEKQGRRAAINGSESSHTALLVMADSSSWLMVRQSGIGTNPTLIPDRPAWPSSRNLALAPECRLSVMLLTVASLMTVTAPRSLLAATVAIRPIACPTSRRRRSRPSLWPPSLLATFPVPARLPDTSWQPSDSSSEPPGRCREPSRAATQHPLWRRIR
ncbi:MAG: hypothetical protein AW11_00737 [Candidatus Accumulibacter regalis]|uniref:Uncharacterized protein n=1 Tax=Accumulibacter regalis TaxID=522306 RepID=A0A011P6D8_ACCRE|nr:MAG: hypothetical protein AW11_00737 [Candidatus Accumulibacter regalis]